MLDQRSSYGTVTAEKQVTRVFTGTPWEPIAGYCRAIKKGNYIFVSGTTATEGDKAIGIGEPAIQMKFIIDKIECSLESLGARLVDVIKTTVFIKNLEDREVIARVHGEAFGKIQPANTMVQVGIIGNEYLVEVEAVAII